MSRGSSNGWKRKRLRKRKRKRSRDKEMEKEKKENGAWKEREGASIHD